MYPPPCPHRAFDRDFEVLRLMEIMFWIFVGREAGQFLLYSRTHSQPAENKDMSSHTFVNIFLHTYIMHTQTHFKTLYCLDENIVHNL